MKYDPYAKPEKSLAMLRAEYLLGLQQHRRKLQRNLAQVEKEIASLPTGEAAVILKRVSGKENPKNEDIFPVIKGVLERAHAGSMRFDLIYSDMVKAGWTFGGPDPAAVLYARMNKEAQKGGMFMKVGRGVFGLNRDGQTPRLVHIGAT